MMKTLIYFFVATLILGNGVNTEDGKEEKQSMEIEFKYKNSKIHPDGKIEKEDFESKDPEEIKKFLEKKPQLAELLNPSTIRKKLQFPEETALLSRPAPLFLKLAPKVTGANGAYPFGRRRRPYSISAERIPPFPKPFFPTFFSESMTEPPSFSSIFSISLKNYPPMKKDTDIDEPENFHINQPPTENGNKEANSTPNLEQLITIVLGIHNEYRKRHNAQPLTHNPEISKFSQEYAEKLSTMDELVHSDQKEYGENLASGSVDDNYENIVRNAVKLWYSEKNSGINGKGHFTQLVWKSSKELGVGFVVTNGTWVLVCNYSPPGNVLGQFDENVEE